MARKPLKIFFYTMDAAGHLYACIGLAESLARRGHSITFLSNYHHFNHQLESCNFRQIPLPAKDEKDRKISGQRGFDLLLKSGMVSDLSSLDKLKVIKYDAILGKMSEQCSRQHNRMAEVLQEERPDLVVIDSYLIPKAIVKSDIPWVYLFSGSPVFMYNTTRLPPKSSGKFQQWIGPWEFSENSLKHSFPGYPTNGQNESELWPVFQAELDRLLLEPMYREQMKLLGEDPDEAPRTHPEFKTFIKSPYLNLYGYPKELDYDDVVARPDKVWPVDAFARDTKKEYRMDEKLKALIESGGKIILFSLGSMAGVNLELMTRLVGLLEVGETGSEFPGSKLTSTFCLPQDSPHKFIVAKGPRAQEYTLPANMWGEAFIAQTELLPLVDLVITHGGNNTVTESFVAGKPMIVMPIFSDQFDNAQRIEEKGFGKRLNGHKCSQQELWQAIDELLYDEKLKERLEAARERICQDQSKVKACEKIEQMVAELGSGKVANGVN